VALIVLIAFLGGLLPALAWLFFWLLEDRCQPEPKRYIFFAFMAGMIAVPLVLPAEEFAAQYLTGFWLLLVWAALEETFKFSAAYITALRRRVFDEPLDAIIYMVTAALGFSALENALFLLTPLYQGNPLHAVVLGDLRFMGATLLHTLASATIGFALAFSFYKSPRTRRWAAFGGVILATALHACFNFFILQGSTAMLGTFVLLWVSIVVVLLLMERAKEPSKNYC
jgi:protease PrsW